MDILSKHRGTLYIRIGPMFSGKTTWLNSVLTDLADKHFSVLKIVHCSDERYISNNDSRNGNGKGSSHSSSFKSLSDKIDVISAKTLSDIDISNYHVIGVDESQFYPDLLETVESWVEEKGKHVRISGLCGDSSKYKFGQTLDLIPICDEVIKLNSSCKLCLVELEKLHFHGNILSIVGPFTKRISNEKGQTLVGVDDKYIPVCRYHHST